MREGPGRFADHPLRAAALNEVHARPFHMMEAPRITLHLAFMTDAPQADAARARLAALCLRNGLPIPGEHARHHVVPLSGGFLRFEVHAEFTTYSWDARGGVGDLPPETPFGEAFEAPGPLMVAARLDLVRDERAVAHLVENFDPGSLAVSRAAGGRALVATDFREDGDGYTRLLVVDRGLGPQEAGPIVQRLLEVETYRTLAMLGLPEAQRLQPEIRHVENELVKIGGLFRASEGLETNRNLLDELTLLAGEVESGAAATAFRFGASRAYAEIVGLRLKAMDEQPIEGYSSFSDFLARRMAPAMRTCQTLESRQQDLSRKLARAAALLRARVDVELSQQNRALLDSMNRRARLQLRLQQTVEGLSVAAVSYYVVGLVGYLVKGSSVLGIELDPAHVTAYAVIPVVLLVWLMVRRIRAHHGGKGED
ncbi:putative membrane-anchored protein [Kaistia hirudinis]|uniref:Putative membrane-anchored protein n=1 Tax=Kaistia hirudinis TaxID=1293440 RepID=A0A840AME1_9HYPH|nr:DUF3422 domain-containing protein [Kaistia hirudinis]MBB3930433.1 putative membrane-anchored protein [Kaistia hirudinis]MBN9017995.1 DUF3422 domain-containing protein [Hyphomicrobiales bacterium]